MALNSKLGNGREKFAGRLMQFKSLFVNRSDVSGKAELNFRSLKTIGISAVFVFIAVVFLLPNDVPVTFAERIERKGGENLDGSNPTNESGRSSSAQSLWGSPQIRATGGGGAGSQVNYNTSMILGSKTGNAKTQLSAGRRLSLRTLDKVVVSQESVPILAEVILDSMSDSGLRLPAGTRLYGEASFQRGSERAQIRFSKLSLPNGQIRSFSGVALGKDGQSGVPGRVFSDGMKNTAGQVITTFVSGLAAGSIETDMLGRSKGGLENGLLAAVAATAKDRASSYGEKLKAEREWIEIAAGTELDALISDSFNLQEEGSSYE